MVKSSEVTKEQFIALMGRFPQRVPLCPVVVNREVSLDISVEKVVFSADSDTVIPSIYLIPTSASGAVPAVVAIHPHGNYFEGGKSSVIGRNGPSDWWYGLELARQGYAVLAIDMLCFGERRPPADVRERYSDMADGSYESFVLAQSLLNGSSLYSRNIFDLQCAVDYLTTRPEVNTERMGVIGHGYGGSLAIGLAFTDTRIKACVCSGGSCSLRYLMRHNICPDVGSVLPGMLTVGDMNDYISCLAPRPLMLISGLHDERQPIDGFREVTLQCSREYTALGVEDRLLIREHGGGGEFPESCRNGAYEWLSDWLG